METFGEWLRQQRNLLRLTRQQYAERVGCSVALLRKIEDGERRPSTQIAELMANGLNITTEDRSIFVRVARGELSVDRLSPLIRPTSRSPTPRTNLPILPTPLIGRQREVEELSQLLSDSQCRLLTLVGPGGMGKTRLAIETAGHMVGVFADGVFFVAFSPVNSTRFIVPVIADAIGFTFDDHNRIDPKMQLFKYLKEKQVLLLIDNLEQLLVEPGIELLAELLAIAPFLKLMATSRESIGLQGEWVYEVQGLPIPDGKFAAESLENTSVELFLQRARRVNVGFVAREIDYPAIVHICQLVGGMPLGIELAAAWVRTLSCNEIAREIEGGLDFLSVAVRDIPVRHQSIRAVFDHSWKLLTEEEQTVLYRLSAFRGVFHREAVEQVAEATLAVLSTLVSKSLVRHSSDGHYDLHELIRQYALERLSEHPEEEMATQARHGRYYMTWFGNQDKRLRSSAQHESLAELTVEMENIRVAWDWAIAHSEYTLIEQSLRTFAMLYDTRGWLQEGFDTLGQSINALETDLNQFALDRSNQIAMGHLLTARALFAYRLSKNELAQAMLERSLDILRPLNEARMLPEPLTFLGTVMILIGSFDRAMELLKEGNEIAQEVGDQWFAAMCQSQEAYAAMLMGKNEYAYERLLSAVEEWRLIGDPRFTAFGLIQLSQCAINLKRYDEARAALEESVELNTSVGARWNLGASYRGLGAVAHAQGEYQQAIIMFRQSLNIFAELGGRQEEARALAEMGHSLCLLGNDADAERAWLNSFRIAVEIHGIPVALDALVGLACLYIEQGELAYALELLVVILNHPASIQETKDHASQMRIEIESKLTIKQIESIQAQMNNKPFETVAAEILNRANV